MNAKFIGVGAAGNKAVISLIEYGVIDKVNAMLLNSTIQDVPEKYKDMAISFSATTGGCGKERARAKTLITDALMNNRVNLDNFLDPDDKTVVIVTSTEGGSGSGASVVIASYFEKAIGIRPHIFAFAGTEDDLRGLQNTIEFFQDIATMCPEATVQCISNKKFLDENNGNKIKAERAANKEFALRMKFLLGQALAASEQNIDEMDLLKINTTPGYMIMGYMPFQDGITSVEEFNKGITSMIAKNKSLPIADGKIDRLGVILNITEEEKDNIDWSYSVIKTKFGEVGETYPHVQYKDQPSYAFFIMAGLSMPVDFVSASYDRYKERSSKVKESSDKFLEVVSGLKGNDKDARFDFKEVAPTSPTLSAKNDFFSSLTGKDVPKNSKFKNTKVNDKTSTDNKNEF